MKMQADACIGIALDGITDPVARCTDAPEPEIIRLPSPRPHCVIPPRYPGERALGGDAAFASLDGRGWVDDGPIERRPVLEMLERLEQTASQSGDTVNGGTGDLIAAHVRAIANQPSGRHILAIPDRLTDVGQQRLLDGMHRANLATELLWRPIATLLGWSLDLTPHQLATLHKRSALVIHLGFWTIEVSIVELEVEEANGRQWLTPVRTGPGLGPSASTPWSVCDVATAVMEADLRQHGLAPTEFALSLERISARPWSILAGETPLDEVVRDRSANWHRLTGAPTISPTLQDPLSSAIQALVHRQAETAKPVDRVLIDGALTGLRSGPITMGQSLSNQLSQWFGGNRDVVEVLAENSCTSVRGAANYGWRRKNGLPTYYDTVPDLKINALVELRPAFISLMQGQKRVQGGQQIGPFDVAGFSIKAESETVDYYLVRSDQPTVRLTKTRLPSLPRSDIPIRLSITQTPGQGFAQVEIRPTGSQRLAAQPVYLDWTSMTDTGKSEELVLDELKDKCGLAYPEPEVFPCHAAVWELAGIADAMLEFLSAMRRDMPTATTAAAQLRERLSTKQSVAFLLKKIKGQDDKAGVFDSFGSIPDEESLRHSLGILSGKHSSYRDLVADVIKTADREFHAIDSSPTKGTNTCDLRRHLLLIGGWTYGGSSETAAPQMILEHLRAIMAEEIQPDCERWLVWAFHAAGRCFCDPDDVYLIANRVTQDFKTSLIERPWYRAKALAFILSHRPEAARALNDEISQVLFDAAIQIMKNNRSNVSQTFYAAAFLSMGLLRYRIEEPAFLNPSLPETRDRIDQIRAIFAGVTGTSAQNLADARRIGEQMIHFIEAKAANVPIFRELDRRSD